jgi:hypothetical protein
VSTGNTRELLVGQALGCIDVPIPIVKITGGIQIIENEQIAGEALADADN